jgi:hypothetical protein
LGAILWCNDLPAPNFAGMPKTMHFQGQGEVVMRSGFGPQDTWVYLRSGPIYNGHQHDDQGNLLIDAYGAELFVENAIGDANHETVYHNSIRVGGSDQIPYGNNAVQRAQPLAGTPYERGRVVQYQPSGAYTYVATDFSNAYPDGVVPVPKSGKVTRELVSILPDLLIVRDRVAAAGTQQVLFHVWSGAGSLNAGSRELTVTRGSGRGWLKTVLPASASLQMTAQGGTSLLTVAAPGSVSGIDFVHVIYLTPSGDGFVPTELTPIDTASHVGVSLRDRQNRLWAVTFQRSGIGLGAVTLDGSGLNAPSAPTGLQIVRQET